MTENPVEEDRQEARNRKFQNACKIWFCPSEERISRELREMPQEEREKVWADLSGNEKTSQFRKDVPEEPEEIARALDEMSTALQEITDKPALDLATKQDGEYVDGRSFRLMFLRSCEYDGKRAAQKLVEHMNTKQQLFGDHCLGRDIKLSDLNEEDMKTLNSGGLQFLPERDNAGRIVLYGHVESVKFKERENLCRALFYSLMTALQDESVQKLGVIFVWNIMSDFSGGYDYEADRLAIQTAAAVPARPVARYLIFKCALWKQVIEVLNHMISPYLRARTRSIHGCHAEVMYSLKCLGIPCDSIPSDDGRVVVENQKKW
eukprot:CAMPEP_0117080352 /NCGR_PEP_ID=MMETSP0472-20121206/56695_1 /TAXON_ID=693140 ORGANISM="Tiarina fusus, Strain LIS" /NCGR_SAMPLE_ID=MMETSP0472 /ASSEMBLY_ACC=CAM_ASM_000603 /LENGTH=319 /DNA_ID=CAMNT_0004807961 /DNA_START=69 /DNA_END=1026 /DNA_ORIENTATION=-